MIQVTCRQKEILQLISQGHTYLEISEKLNLSQDTIKTHARKILCNNPDYRNMIHIVATATKEKII